MLEIDDQKYFNEIKEAAKKLGLAEQLQGQLDYLDGYAQHIGTRCRLYKDHAPMSFQFCMDKKTPEGPFVFWFNGGLIYQGPGQPADGSAPSFTVSLHSDHGWFVHT